MKKTLILFWPVVFIFLLWFIFASPYLLKGMVPYASTYQVNFFPPWSHYEKFWGPVKNNAMPDIHGQIYPWKKFTIDALKLGQIPLWNPYNFSGNPHLANYQSAVLSPFNLLFFLPAGRQGILPFIDGWSILVLLQPLLAGIFIYFLVRTYKTSKIASLISAISFMFCGFIVVWMAYGTLAMAIVFLPLALFAIEKHHQTKKLRFLFLLSISIPLSFFSGHFQTSFYFLIVTVSYILFKGIIMRELSAIRYTLYAIFIGLLFSLPQILPSIDLYRESVRSEIFTTGGGIPLHYLVNIFSPDFFGNPVTRNDWFGYYAEWASFIGIIPLLLSFFALGKKKSHVLFFLLSGFFALALAIDSPLQLLISSFKIPVLSTSIPSRIIVLFSFSFAVLAGFGLDALKEYLLKRSTKKIFFPLFVIGILLTIIWLLLSVGKVMANDKLIIAERNLFIPTLLYVGSVISIFFSWKRKELFFLVACFFLLGTSFDSLRFAQKWMPFDPKELVFVQVPIIDAIKKNIGDGRIFGNIGAELSTYYGFPSIEGYDPLYIGRYGEFIRSAETGDFQKGERSVVKLARSGKYINRVLDLLGVGLIFHPIPDTNQGWAYPVWKDLKKFSLVYHDDKFQLFRNNDAIPRAALFYRTEIVKNDKEIIKRFYTENFDFRKTLIIEEPLNVVLKDGTGSAKIISYTPNKVKIVVTTDTPALLFLADNYYPGWKAKFYFFEASTRETKIYRADYTFRAIVVPSGTSIVEFSYENWNF